MSTSMPQTTESDALVNLLLTAMAVCRREKKKIKLSRVKRELSDTRGIFDLFKKKKEEETESLTKEIEILKTRLNDVVLSNATLTKETVLKDSLLEKKVEETESLTKEIEILKTRLNDVVVSNATLTKETVLKDSLLEKKVEETESLTKEIEILNKRLNGALEDKEEVECLKDQIEILNKKLTYDFISTSIISAKESVAKDKPVEKQQVGACENILAFPSNSAEANAVVINKKSNRRTNKELRRVSTHPYNLRVRHKRTT